MPNGRSNTVEILEAVPYIGNSTSAYSDSIR